MKTAWPIVRHLAGGKIQVDLGRVFGKRIQKQFSDQVAADEFVDTKRRELESLGAANTKYLTDLAKLDSVAALRLLDGRASLTEAAQFYIRNARQASCHTTVSQTVIEFLAAKKAANRRKRTIRGYRSILEHFAETFGKSILANVTTADIDQWLNSCGYKGVSRGNQITALRVFYTFSIKRGYVLNSPAAGLERPASDMQMPRIFSVDQVERLLSAAAKLHPGMVPYYAIGIFAGLRPGELLQLRRESINLAESYIQVMPATSKNRRRNRFVDIQPNMLRWITAYPIDGETVQHSRRQDKAIRKAAGVEWSGDVMRHTFASFHLAHWEDAAKTMLQMGHSSAQMLFDHYRNLVKKSDAARFWKIAPPDDQACLQFPVSAVAGA